VCKDGIVDGQDAFEEGLSLGIQMVFRSACCQKGSVVLA
jgi:hypothetical protein